MCFREKTAVDVRVSAFVMTFLSSSYTYPYYALPVFTGEKKTLDALVQNSTIWSLQIMGGTCTEFTMYSCKDNIGDIQLVVLIYFWG